jgi:CheY-like chemotaxis protein
MARGFAEQSGGAFAIRSDPGRGTTVTLWFPQADPGAPRAEPAQAASPAPQDGPARHVLVVDDDAMVRAVLAGQLDEAGYQVAEASDGLAALASLDAGGTVDVLVTDLSMPGMNGLVLIEEARRRRPGLPVMVLTGYADQATGLDVAALGGRATVLLRKPVSGDDLARAVAALLAEQADEPD